MATQEQRRTATTAAIVAAARGLFVTKGFAATSVDDIARAAGVAKGGVYHHFETKERLFEAIFRGIEDELYDVVVRAASARRRPIEQLVAGTRAFMDRCLDPEVHRVVLVDGPNVLGWQLWREIDAEHFLPLITASLAAEAGVRAAGRDAEVTVVAQLLIGAIDEAVMILASASDPAAEVAAITDGLEVLLRSVSATLRRGRGSSPANGASAGAG